MLTQQQQEESLSRAHIQAIAARAGLVARFNDYHDHAVDGSFHTIQVIKGKHVQSGFPLEFQTKASVKCEVKEKDVIYDLEVDAFNYMVKRNSEAGGVPIILVLLVLPTAQEDWVAHDEEQLQLRRSCYWELLKGEPTQNTATVRIKIPREQHFNAKALMKLMERRRKGEL